MDPDLALVLGLVIVGFSVPAMMSAFSDRRAPRAPILVLLIGAALVLWAIATSPTGYRIDDLPEVFFGVVARVWP